MNQLAGGAPASRYSIGTITRNPRGWNSEAALGDQALNCLLQGLLGDPQHRERFLARERVAARGLIGVDEVRKAPGAGLRLWKQNGTPCGPFCIRHARDHA